MTFINAKNKIKNAQFQKEKNTKTIYTLPKNTQKHNTKINTTPKPTYIY